MTENNHYAAGGTWIVVMGRGERSMLDDARARGIAARTVIWRDDVPRDPAGLRRLRAQVPHDHGAIVTSDWDLELNPQLYELALRLLPVRRRWLVDLSSDDAPRPLPASRLTRRCFMLPAAAAAGASEGIAAVAAAAVPLRSSRAPRTSPHVVGVWVNHGSAPVGGAVTHVGGIMTGFAKAGYETALVTTDPIPAHLREQVGSHLVSKPLPAHDRVTSDIHAMAVNRTVAAELRRAVPATRPAFLYQRHFPFITAGVRVARSTGVPLVLEFNNSESWARKNWNVPSRPERALDPVLRWSERLVLRQADLVVAVSSQAASMALAGGARPERVTVVPNGVDIEAIDRVRARAIRPAASPTIGWIGSFGVWHGAEVLVEAISHLPNNVRALMIGDGGTRPACMELAETLGIASRIEWTGSLPHGEAVARLAGCDLLASPHVDFQGQRFFGSPTKLFEFMALELPIVASRLEQLEEILDDGRTAVLVAPRDASALADGIRTVLADSALAARLATGAREEAVAHHDWSGRARQITDKLSALRVL